MWVGRPTQRCGPVRHARLGRGPALDTDRHADKKRATCGSTNGFVGFGDVVRQDAAAGAGLARGGRARHCRPGQPMPAHSHHHAGCLVMLIRSYAVQVPKEWLRRVVVDGLATRVPLPPPQYTFMHIQALVKPSHAESGPSDYFMRVETTVIPKSDRRALYVLLCPPRFEPSKSIAYCDHCDLYFSMMMMMITAY